MNDEIFSFPPNNGGCKQILLSIPLKNQHPVENNISAKQKREFHD
jgi:hypothetical protein